MTSEEQPPPIEQELNALQAIVLELMSYKQLFVAAERIAEIGHRLPVLQSALQTLQERRRAVDQELLEKHQRLSDVSTAAHNLGASHD